MIPLKGDSKTAGQKSGSFHSNYHSKKPGIRNAIKAKNMKTKNNDKYAYYEALRP